MVRNEPDNEACVFVVLALRGGGARAGARALDRRGTRMWVARRPCARAVDQLVDDRSPPCDRVSRGQRFQFDWDIFNSTN